MVYSYQGEVIENALKAKVADMRLKGGKSKGFFVYQAAIIPEITSYPLDYSFKIDQNGIKGKEQTTLYMIMQGSNALAGDPIVLAANAKTFLERMVPDVERADLVMQIKKQEDILVKEEKKMKALTDEHDSLTKKLKSNESDQEKQQRIINSQKSILEDLKSKQR
ncbi:MAG: hypothetical protein IPH58_09210 [Sphingobacteriales bacterium]|nr:hypothetical protein [Sphingobacteriales bacterium]